MDILLRREETIKRLEVRARNALEISIRADDFVKSSSSSSGWNSFSLFLSSLFSLFFFFNPFFRYEQLEFKNKELAAEKEKLNLQMTELLASKENSYPGKFQTWRWNI